MNWLKVTINRESMRLGYHFLNDRGEWRMVPNTSPLSREEFSKLDLNKSPEVLLDYLLQSPYCSDDGLEIVLEGDEEVYKNLILTGKKKQYDGIRIAVKGKNIVVAGKAASGKSTLITALDDFWKWQLLKTDNDLYQEYHATSGCSGVVVFEVAGIEIEDDNYAKIMGTLEKLNSKFDSSQLIYCIRGDVGKIEDFEIRLLEMIRERFPMMSVIIAITSCIDARKGTIFCDRIKELFENVQVVKLLAKDMEMRNDKVLKAYGLSDLNKCIFEG